MILVYVVLLYYTTINIKEYYKDYLTFLASRGACASSTSGTQAAAGAGQNLGFSRRWESGPVAARVLSCLFSPR